MAVEHPLAEQMKVWVAVSIEREFGVECLVQVELPGFARLDLGDKRLPR